jgi:hypothetical protein
MSLTVAAVVFGLALGVVISVLCLLRMAKLADRRELSDRVLRDIKREADETELQRQRANKSVLESLHDEEGWEDARK